MSVADHIKNFYTKRNLKSRRVSYHERNDVISEHQRLKRYSSISVWALTIRVLFLHLIGLYLFSSGFLLSRLESNQKNNCTSLGILKDSQYHCWQKPRFSKAVVVLIDALRFDFADYNNTFDDNNPPPYFLNKLPVFANLVQKYPDRSLLFKARADAPTTTLQRLKALTTGSLPTFVDAGSNFGGMMITEDNIIEQWRTVFKDDMLVVMGDDTWLSLFPNSFTRSFPFPSFDIRDLHTVDDGVLANLIPLMSEKSSNWKLIVAHFLGVDHVGHKLGPEHIVMQEKLQQMNSALEALVSLLDDDTVLFVLGDHGMDPKGDHGGESENELATTLFVHSKSKLIEKNKDTYQQLQLLSSMLNMEESYSFSDSDGTRNIAQIDFVPTISLMLGLPIPFGNLGSVIPELFLSAENGSKFLNLLEATRLNAHQIHQFLLHHFNGKESMSSELWEPFKKVEQLYQRSILDGHDNEDIVIAISKYINFMRKALKITRKMWAQFDLPLMFMGMCTLSMTVLCLLVEICVDVAPDVYSMFRGTLSGALVGLVISQTAFSFQVTALHWGLFGLSLGLSTSVIYSLTRYGCNLSFPELPSILATVLILFFAMIPASVSWTRHEDAVTWYLLASFSLYLGYVAWNRRQERQLNADWWLLLLIFTSLAYLSTFSTICRDDQEDCRQSFNSSATSSVASLQTILYTLVEVVIQTFIFRKQSNDTRGIRVNQRVYLPLTLFLNWIYWTLDTLEGQNLLFVEWKPWIARLGFPLMASLIMYEKHKSLKNNEKWNFVQRSDCSIIFVLVSIVQKPMGRIMLGCLFIQCCCLDLLYRKELNIQPRKRNASLFLYIVILHILGQRYFFATGHQTSFTSIQWEVGFIGLEKVNWLVSGCIIALNTFGSHIIILPWIAKLALHKNGTFSNRVYVGFLYYFLSLSVWLLMSAVFAGYFRRHLGAFTIFAPKFVFTALTTLFVLVALFGTLTIFAMAVHFREHDQYLFRLKPLEKKG